MVSYDVIRQIGVKLVNSDIEHLTAGKLFELLRSATNTQSNKTLRHYAKILRDENYIKFTSDGVWRINKEKKQKQKDIMEWQ